MERSWNLNEASDSATGLPYRWAIKGFLPAGMLLLGVASIAVLLRKFIELFGSPEHRRALSDESTEVPERPEPTTPGREQ